MSKSKNTFKIGNYTYNMDLINLFAKREYEEQESLVERLKNHLKEAERDLEFTRKQVECDHQFDATQQMPRIECKKCHLDVWGPDGRYGDVW